MIAIHQLFSYGSSGNVVSVDYSSNGGSTFTTFYYLRNAQNDIVKIVDGNGNAVVEYTYDSWGKPISTTGSLSATSVLISPSATGGMFTILKQDGTISRVGIMTPLSLDSFLLMYFCRPVREC